MTEKRFTSSYNGDESLLTSFLDNNKPLSKQEVLDLLNELHNENEQLKQESKKLHDTIFSLRTELAHQRTEKEKHSDSAYTFLKKLEKW